MTEWRTKLSDEAYEAELAARAGRFGWTMGAVDRVLSTNCIGVEVSHQPGSMVPGWTDGETVTINPGALPRLVDEYGHPIATNLAVWLGINAHEVGHTMFTPRKGSPLRVQLENLEADGMYKGIGHLENLAEDQRQERLTIGRFRPWGTYLSAAAIRLICEGFANSPAQNRHEELDRELSETWPLLAGRTWLPAKVRREARDAWDAEHGAGSGQRIADLIGEYQRIADPGYEDAKQAKQVLMALHTELIGQQVVVTMMPGGCAGPDHGSMEDNLDEGDMPDVGTADDDRVPSAGSDQDNEALGEGDGDTGDGAEGEGSEDSDSDSQVSNDDTDEAGAGDEAGSDEDASSEGEGDGDGDAGDASEGGDEGEGAGEGEGEDDTAQSQGQGGGAGQGVGAKTLGDLRGAINDQVRTALAHDAKVRKDLADVAKALDGGKHHSQLGTESRDGSRQSVSDVGNSHPRDEYVPASHDTRRMAREVSEHMRHLVDETLPQWNRRVETGKLNVGRYMRRDVGDPLDTMFDRFQQGMQDDVSLDVSIMIDVSSSMGWMPQLGPSPKHPVTGLPTGWPPTIKPAAEAMWAIRRAVEAAEGEVTVYAFDTTGYILVPTGRRTDPEQVLVPAVGGGTDPTELLNELWNRLPTVQARHKVVVAITDGQWAGNSAKGVMESLSDRGAVTVGVVLDTYLNVPQGGDEGLTKARREEYQASRRKLMANYLEGMGVTYGAVMDNPHDIVPLFDQVVTEVMLRAMQGVA